MSTRTLSCYPKYPIRLTRQALETRCPISSGFRPTCWSDVESIPNAYSSFFRTPYRSNSWSKSSELNLLRDAPPNVAIPQSGSDEMMRPEFSLRNRRVRDLFSADYIFLNSQRTLPFRAVSVAYCGSRLYFGHRGSHYF